MKLPRAFNKRTLSRISILFLTFFSLVSFQNCSNSGFEVLKSDESSQSFLSDVAPTINILSKPSFLTNLRNARIVFSAVSSPSFVISRYECKEKGAKSYSACTSPKDYSSLVDGDYELSVRAVDGLGFFSDAAIVRWTVDGTTPTVSFSSTPQAINGSSSALFQFSASDNYSTTVVTECSIDGETTYSTCVSPVSKTGLATGNHTFRVRAKDAAGNISSIATYNWEIDLTVPVIAMTPNFSTPSNQTSARFTFSATDDGSPLTTGFECRSNNAAYASCSSPFQLNALTSGTHTFDVRVRDSSGNLSSPRSFQFVVDLVSPSISIGAQPSPYYRTKAISLNFSTSDNSMAALTIQCRLDSGTYAACTNNSSYTLPTTITDGPHTVGIRATDAAGNITTVTSNSFTVDTIAPTIGTITGPSATTTAASASFAFTSQDTTSGIRSVECQLDGRGYSACVSPRAYSNLSEGQHVFNVRVTDNALNVASRTYSWTVMNSACKTGAIISWTAPTTNEDGTMATNLGGYRISYGNLPGQYNRTIDIPGAAIDSHTLTNLSSGNYFFAIQAYNSNNGSNLYSAYSSEASITIEQCIVANVNFSTKQASNSRRLPASVLTALVTSDRLSSTLFSLLKVAHNYFISY